MRKKQLFQTTFVKNTKLFKATFYSKHKLFKATFDAHIRFLIGLRFHVFALVQQILLNLYSLPFISHYILVFDSYKNYRIFYN